MTRLIECFDVWSIHGRRKKMARVWSRPDFSRVGPGWVAPYVLGIRGSCCSERRPLAACLRRKLFVTGPTSDSKISWDRKLTRLRRYKTALLFVYGEGHRDRSAARCPSSPSAAGANFDSTHRKYGTHLQNWAGNKLCRQGSLIERRNFSWRRLGVTQKLSCL